MKKLIAALDFSDASEAVLRETKAMAEALGAQVHLVHAIESLTNFYDIYGYTVPDTSEFEEHARERAAVRLAEKARELGLPDGRVVSKVLEGSAVDAILDYANEHSESILVLGTHGHGVLSRVLVGSVAEKLLRRAHIPMLMVPVREA